MVANADRSRTNRQTDRQTDPTENNATLATRVVIKRHMVATSEALE